MAASVRVPDGRESPTGRSWAGLFSWLVPTPPEDADALRALAVTLGVAALVAAIAPLYALLTWWVAPAPALDYGLALLVFVAATAALSLAARGRVLGGARLLVAASALTVLVPLFREGASAVVAGNFVIVLVMAALLLGWRAALVLALPFSMLVLCPIWAQNRRWFLGHPEPSLPGVFGVLQLATLSALFVVSNRASSGAGAHCQRSELELARAQRMDALGRLAGGVAHDFNSLLTVILANAELIERSHQAPVHGELQGIRSAARRGAELTKQLLSLSRKQSLEPVIMDLRGVIEDLEQLLRPVIPEGIRMEFDPSDEPALIYADPSQIAQVVMNLALNARDAMPAGGVLHFGVEVVEATNVSANPRASRVRLTVSDTGTGMDAATVEHLFEPFFTTKPPGAGTGLGLSTVQGIVAQSGGTVRVQSSPGFGSRFEVSLPLASSG